MRTINQNANIRPKKNLYDYIVYLVVDMINQIRKGNYLHCVFLGYAFQFRYPTNKMTFS